MPLYEFRCRTCDERFEVRRSMVDAAAAAPCPGGHADTVRLLSTFASTGSAPARSAVPSGGGGGGCCGGGCGCRA
ncbi:MAG: zinc ribbon domain-containing protein [Ilumatobacteraceae bacterium]